MLKIILLMLVCCSANAAMYSCVDKSGAKVLRSSPCDQNEKQQTVEKIVTPSYYIIDGTGERQSFSRRETGLQSSAQTDARSSAMQNDDVSLDQSREKCWMVNMQGVQNDPVAWEVDKDCRRLPSFTGEKSSGRLGVETAGWCIKKYGANTGSKYASTYIASACNKLYPKQ